MRAYEDEGIVDHARQVGTDVIGARLAEIADRHEIVGEVRGTGVFWAVELVADRGTREPVSAKVMGDLKGRLLEAGYLPFMAENRVHVVPPAVITEDELDEGLSILDAALGAAAV